MLPPRRVVGISTRGVDMLFLFGVMGILMAVLDVHTPCNIITVLAGTVEVIPRVKHILLIESYVSHALLVQRDRYIGN